MSGPAPRIVAINAGSSSIKFALYHTAVRDAGYTARLADTIADAEN